jgi:hypothetical protein
MMNLEQDLPADFLDRVLEEALPCECGIPPQNKKPDTTLRDSDGQTLAIGESIVPDGQDTLGYFYPDQPIHPDSLELRPLFLQHSDGQRTELSDFYHHEIGTDKLLFANEDAEQ